MADPRTSQEASRAAEELRRCVKAIVDHVDKHATPGDGVLMLPRADLGRHVYGAPHRMTLALDELGGLIERAYDLSARAQDTGSLGEALARIAKTSGVCSMELGGYVRVEDYDLLKQLRVPEILATSFPEIMATFGAVISGSVASQTLGATGLPAARNKEDDQNVGSRTNPCTS